MARFCAECGVTGKPLLDNFCQTCYSKFNPLTSLRQSRLEIPYCLTCYAVKTANGWTNENSQTQLPEVISYAFMRNIACNPDVDLKVLEPSEINWMDPNPAFTLNYQANALIYPEFDIQLEDVAFEVKLHGGICTSCVKKKTGSREVTIQIRAKNRSLTQSEIDRISTLAFEKARTMSHEIRDAYIGDILEIHGGLDIFVGSQVLAEGIVNDIKKSWIGYHEKNFKLITEEKDNKRVYSVTHLYRLPEFVRDDIVVYNNELYKVDKIQQRGIRLIKYLDNTQHFITQWEEIMHPDFDPYQVKKLVVSEDTQTNSYLLMDLQSFETEEVDKSRFHQPLPLSTEVSLLLWHDNYYQPL